MDLLDAITEQVHYLEHANEEFQMRHTHEPLPLSAISAVLPFDFSSLGRLVCRPVSGFAASCQKHSRIVFLSLATIFFAVGRGTLCYVVLQSFPQSLSLVQRPAREYSRVWSLRF